MSQTRMFQNDETKALAKLMEFVLTGDEKKAEAIVDMHPELIFKTCKLDERFRKYLYDAHLDTPINMEYSPCGLARCLLSKKMIAIFKRHIKDEDKPRFAEVHQNAAAIEAKQELVNFSSVIKSIDQFLGNIQALDKEYKYQKALGEDKPDLKPMTQYLTARDFVKSSALIFTKDQCLLEITKEVDRLRKRAYSQLNLDRSVKEELYEFHRTLTSHRNNASYNFKNLIEAYMVRERHLDWGFDQHTFFWDFVINPLQENLARSFALFVENVHEPDSSIQGAQLMEMALTGYFHKNALSISMVNEDIACYGVQTLTDFISGKTSYKNLIYLDASKNLSHWYQDTLDKLQNDMQPMTRFITPPPKPSGGCCVIT